MDSPSVATEPVNEGFITNGIATFEEDSVEEGVPTGDVEEKGESRTRDLVIEAAEALLELNSESDQNSIDMNRMAYVGGYLSRRLSGNFPFSVPARLQVLQEGGF